MEGNIFTKKRRDGTKDEKNKTKNKVRRKVTQNPNRESDLVYFGSLNIKMLKKVI